MSVDAFEIFVSVHCFLRALWIIPSHLNCVCAKVRPVLWFLSIGI